jgi:E3 ubiquitin-protein ligase EDD1
MVPASSIPEELIAQAQVVLQGKSRETIVRELQRTNLNVNEAVNNLLSRDDDEGSLRRQGDPVQTVSVDSRRRVGRD